MSGRHRRPFYQRLSAGWTWGRGPWVQVAGGEHGSRSTGWFGGRWYLFRRRRRS